MILHAALKGVPNQSKSALSCCGEVLSIFDTFAVKQQTLRTAAQSSMVPPLQWSTILLQDFYRSGSDAVACAAMVRGRGKGRACIQREGRRPAKAGAVAKAGQRRSFTLMVKIINWLGHIRDADMSKRIDKNGPDMAGRGTEGQGHHAIFFKFATGLTGQVSTTSSPASARRSGMTSHRLS